MSIAVAGTIPCESALCLSHGGTPAASSLTHYLLVQPSLLHTSPLDGGCILAAERSAGERGDAVATRVACEGSRQARSDY